MTMSPEVLLRNAAALVRRRVPAEEVEDVAQTIVCDALAARRDLPSEEEHRRFVAGIARHKVADFHRRARRRLDDATDEIDAAGPCDAMRYEARALLDRVVASVDGPRERETFEWLVREHHGEQLAEIAEEAGIPAPAVRQRVSRLRRLLRARWSHALAFLLVAGSCGAIARQAASPTDTIVADPIGDEATRAIGLAQGTWRVDRVLDDPALVASSVASVMRVRVEGSRITVGRTKREIVRVTSAGDGSLSLDLRDASGRIDHATVRWGDDASLVVTLSDGPLRGSARLVRE
jgi:RNA polymerase sigma factor (sigma-70 family)